MFPGPKLTFAFGVLAAPVSSQRSQKFSAAVDGADVARFPAYRFVASLFRSATALAEELLNGFADSPNIAPR